MPNATTLEVRVATVPAQTIGPHSMHALTQLKLRAGSRVGTMRCSGAGRRPCKRARTRRRVKSTNRKTRLTALFVPVPLGNGERCAQGSPYNHNF
eukprot:6483249-Amphidinium_carterae.2